MAKGPSCCHGCCHGCATCLLGLYSCRWAKNKRKGLRTTKCDCSWFFFLFCVCLFALVWLYHALILLNDFHNFNEFLFRQTQWWVDWSLPLLGVTVLLVTYSALLLVLALCLQLCGQPLKLHCLHKCLLILTALVVAAAFVALDVKWTEQWQSARISLQATGPFLHIGAVAGVTLLAWPVADCFYRTRRAAPKVLLLLVYFGVTAALYLAPLMISSPCLMEENKLPPKPALAGHRGAPMPCPSTPPWHQSLDVALVSAQSFTASGYLINSDKSLAQPPSCHVSKPPANTISPIADRIPFLMHDETLTRTTNVQKVFNAQATMSGTTFNWTDLQQLDAGSWFLERNPFRSVQGLSSEAQGQARAQKIPSLEQVLQEAKQHNISIMFDLRPENHTDYQSFVNVTVATILESGIPPQLVTWVPDGLRDQVRQQAPGFQQIYGLKSSWNETESPLRLNLPYQDVSTEQIGRYRQDNISVNLYVVNEPWLFSVLWCAGAGSVTTNACQVLKEMKRPLWLLPRNTYLMVWIVIDCVSFLLLLSAFLLLQKCSRRKEPAESKSDVLLTKINSLMQE
ncbi:glycerophosphoinositol inositolphosphodiesterase GDPD2 [Terrapene carolina triunguis]|uniref:glycerophosphoinositol inositolphosphodiesterase GDPD2 n=1 Tax=Terrapene triunguis TaxID=2587831 RepID=UPI0011567CC9|nr:glycerophosphoinositol inositolphosphodiesterase GDPD2 [Terrapene carolina triunguis]